jgi:hypothetical protein
MRKTPVVGSVVLLLVGFSGCAGVPQRVSWSSPPADRSDAADSPTPSRFSWWRQPRAEAATTDSPSNVAEAGKATEPAASTEVPVNVWPESRSEWLARQFPIMSRLWNGRPTGNARDADPSLRSDLDRVSARSQPAPLPGAGRADADVRPVDGSADDDVTSSGRRAISGQREPDVRAPLPTPMRVTFRPHSLPESSGDVELDVSNSELWGDCPARSVESGESLQPPSSTLPPPAPPGEERPAIQPTQPETPSTPVVEEPKPETREETNPQLAQAPSVPEVPKQEVQQPSPPSVQTAPAPVSVQTQAPPPASDQPVVRGSSQAIYASPPPVAPQEPRHKFLSWLFVEEKIEPLASPQFPPATFPPTYHAHSPQPGQVLAAPQAHAVTAAVATKAPKKPCFLKVWFQKPKGCGHVSCCTGCHHAGCASCCHGCACHCGKNPSVAASPQASAPSPQGNSASPQGNPPSQVVPIRSTGTEPGDVAQEGKVGETAASEGLDKSSQR